MNQTNANDKPSTTCLLHVQACTLHALAPSAQHPVRLEGLKPQSPHDLSLLFQVSLHIATGSSTTGPHRLP
jgi:hypothetical protein